MLEEVFNPYIDPQFKVHVSDITFAYDNHNQDPNQDLILLLTRRGEAGQMIKSMRYEKVQKVLQLDKKEDQPKNY